MGRADEDLRIGAPPARALDHLFAYVPVSTGVDLVEAYTLSRQQLLRILAIISTSTLAAPARMSARAQPSTVAPEVSTSSMRTSRRPATAALPSSGTRNAPCTLAARS